MKETFSSVRDTDKESLRTAIPKGGEATLTQGSGKTICGMDRGFSHTALVERCSGVPG